MVYGFESVKIVEIPTTVDKRGCLSIIEGGLDIPFNIARIYYLWNFNTSTTRGGHAHKELWQGFVAIHGSFRIVLNDGVDSMDYSLNRPDTCLILPPGFWREIFSLSDGSVLLVLASRLYEESDYIRLYAEYVEYIKTRQIGFENNVD